MKTLKELLANIGDFRINDADIAQLVKWGVKFPSPEDFDDLDTPGNQCDYTDTAVTNFDLGEVESVTVSGTTHVDSAGVENWTELHQFQHAENLEFVVCEVELRDGE